MFSQLRSRNLLLIGCDFADWLSRFFLRLSNSERLFSDQRTKKEFLVGSETSRRRNFTVFLERFSQDSRCYAIEARPSWRSCTGAGRERNPALEPPRGPRATPGGRVPGERHHLH